MNRWFGLFVVVLTSPVWADESMTAPKRLAPERDLLISVANVDRLVGNFADWTKTYEPPAGKYEFHSVFLCQNRPWGVPITAPQSCYPVVWARSLDGRIGYAQADDTYGDTQMHKPNEWYRLSPKWNTKLEWRLRPRSSPMTVSTFVPPKDIDRDYIFPPGNTNNARYAPPNRWRHSE